MNPQPFSSLNHLTLPTAMFPPLPDSSIPGAPPARLRVSFLEGGRQPRGGRLPRAQRDTSGNPERPRSERRQGSSPTEHRSSREKRNKTYDPALHRGLTAMSFRTAKLPSQRGPMRRLLRGN